MNQSFETASPLAAIILAAGKGTRMKSKRHKVLHPIGGQPMLDHLFQTLSALKVQSTTLVVGALKEQLEPYKAHAELVEQSPQLGTGHAVQQAWESLKEFNGIVLVLYGDVPLIRAETLFALVSSLENAGDDCALSVLGFRAKDPARYGRMIVEDDALLAIREWKDATSSERAIDLCNSGIMAVRAPLLFELLSQVKNENAAQEYYLTDIVGLADQKGLKAVYTEADEEEVAGVNSRVDLAQLERMFQTRRRQQAMEAGVTLIDPETVHFSHDTALSNDVIVEPNVVFGPKVRVEDGVVIKAFSHLEGCIVKSGASVGPFARLRPGANVGEGAKVGNFVELKNAELNAGAKVSHLTYLGDAVVGENANIGAGTISCNYDGYFKYQTEIGAGAFIGSNSALVAPVKIGDGAIVGAGSVVTRDVEKDDLVVARGKQRSITGWAKAFRDRMLEKKKGL
ncbi:MAG: bifunctional UDP-N-acetylglucosamine diphosphorylase/glucosamine-1-phosphate N-acetyltransferase GlmU [Sphingomonadales bacterium]|jgi:bifunctional UDP-N-acetylglucosamine pyrophosphorylase/glucosamine-1-phosphate N-acetyltransferase